MDKKELDILSIATIRSLAIDIINKAKSGHPGMALGSAPMLYTLFTRHLVVDPNHPDFFNRDRFVLSSGHASALLYTMLHLSGYKISMDDLKSFRQLGSITPGHPEYKFTPGVDATSGPLGQGIAQAVGMALAEEHIRASYPRGEELCNHYTYVLCGDGCLEEGLSQEAISFAGHNKLNKLILMYDKNNITLDGGLELSSSDNPSLRFKASNWNVIEVKDGNDIEAIDKALKKAKKSDKPTVIIVNTIIGFGSSKQGTSKVHGSPLGEEDGKAAKLSYGFDHPDFYVPEEVYAHFNKCVANKGKRAYNKYRKIVKEYALSNKEDYERFYDAVEGKVELSLDKDFSIDNVNDSSRVASGKCLNELYHKVPFMFGGSADVAGSVMTKLNEGSTYSPENKAGRNINYGIREFLMASIANGMMLHKGVKAYVGSFLVFSDYMKSAVRMSALSHLPVIYLFSHDSVALGEDGPTHQPIEHLAMLRSIPNLIVLRPGDARETYASWEIALKAKDTPVALILSRQNLPLFGSKYNEVKKGAYIVSDAKDGNADAILLATGSEVSLALEAKNKLDALGILTRVVSMPSVELFEKQSEEYKAKILGKDKSKVFAVEMLSSFGWYKYADTVMGIDTFGVSAPSKDAIRHFDFTSDHLVKLVMEKR